MDIYSCSLWDILKDVKNKKYVIDLDDRVQMLKLLLNVVEFLQSQNICHFDIKPANFYIRTTKTEKMLKKKTVTKQKWTGLKTDFVLGDFGLAQTKSRNKVLTGSSGTPGTSASILPM